MAQRTAGQRTAERGGDRSAGLDVMRCCAVTMVLLSHFGDIFSAWLGGRAPVAMSISGFFGVELFFVLSGFLIGRILIETVSRDLSASAWLVFVVRRWMRTLPLYYMWLVVLALVWPPDGRLIDRLPTYIVFAQNLAWPMPADNWFGVSWSLAIEEWFYLAFSIALFAACRLLGTRLGVAVALAVFLIAPVTVRLALPAESAWAGSIAKMTILRLDAIAYGVAAAWIALRMPNLFRAPIVCLVLGLAMIVLIWTNAVTPFIRVDPWLQRSLIFNVTSLGFVLMLPGAVALRRLSRPFGPLAAAFSQISYPIYIMHLSILEVLVLLVWRDHWPVWLAMSMAGCLTILLPALSWRWLERPILASRPVRISPGRLAEAD